MDVSNPMADVVPSAHGPVLAALAATTTPLTGRAIAELTRPRVSQPRVASILKELADAGLAIRTPAGSASLFSLNREHLAAGPVEALASLRTRLWERVAEHASAWTHVPDAVVVYGSAARGDGGSPCGRRSRFRLPWRAVPGGTAEARCATSRGGPRARRARAFRSF